MSENKELFKELFNTWVKRPGAAELLAWLETTDFFEAPASTRYHGAYPGGLVAHSLNVCRELMSSLSTDASTEIRAICALLHDVCKAGVYHPETKRRRDPATGRWEDYQGYTYDDPFPFGHGEKSVYLVSRFIRLTDEEALAIRWHMGAYDDAARGGGRTLSAAMSVSGLVYELHAADMRASQKEQREEADAG